MAYHQLSANQIVMSNSDNSGSISCPTSIQDSFNLLAENVVTKTKLEEELKLLYIHMLTMVEESEKKQAEKIIKLEAEIERLKYPKPA